MKNLILFIKDLIVLFFICSFIFFSFAFIGYFTLAFFIKGETVEMPVLHRLTITQALEKLNKLGLNARMVEYKYNNKVERNHIISQYPVAGTKVKKNSTVKLIVSKGPEKIKMPNLLNLELLQAKLLLQKNYLSVGTISYFYSRTVPKGYVINQSVKPGVMVDQETKINLLVSKGPKVKILSMPNLLNLKLEKARSILEEANLKTGNIDEVINDNYPEYTVLYQSPKPGTPVKEYSSVDLTVAVSSLNYEYYGKRLKIIIVPYIRLNPFVKSEVDVLISDEYNEQVCVYKANMGTGVMRIPITLIGKGYVKVFEKEYLRLSYTSDDFFITRNHRGMLFINMKGYLNLFYKE